MFSSLEENELKKLAEISHIVRYRENSNLFLKGDVSNSLMLLIEGIVSIFKHDNKGNEIVIGYFTRYKLLAEAATLRHTPLPSSATFKSDGAILKIDLKKFEELFMAHPHISYAIIQSLYYKRLSFYSRTFILTLLLLLLKKYSFFYEAKPKNELRFKTI